MDGFLGMTPSAMTSLTTHDFLREKPSKLPFALFGLLKNKEFDP